MAYCKKCQKDIPVKFIETPDLVHYGKEICSICKGFIRWVKKPEGKEIHSKFTIKNFKIDYCEICGRKRNELGSNETFEIHHKIPLCEGGEDTKENILILCTACHRQVHWLRTYLNYHNKNKVGEINHDEIIEIARNSRVS